MKVIKILFCLLIYNTAQAWNHEISLGYGRSHEVGFNYYNYGLFLNAKLYKFKEIDKTLIATIDCSLAHWNATTEDYKNLNTAAISFAFRAYFTSPKKHKIRPYLLASFGPAYLSRKHFGEQIQGAHFAFQTTMGGGLEITKFDFNLRMAHYCNGGIFKPNQGTDILFVFSTGYLF